MLGSWRAAGIKAHGLALGPTGDRTVPPSPRLATTTLEAKTLPGIWLRGGQTAQVVFGYLFPIGLVLALCGCQSSETTANRVLAARKATLLQASPEEVDLGTVGQTAQKRFSFSLRNDSAQPVRVAKIEASCPCLRLPCPDRDLAPDTTTQLEAELDMREEPGFSGGLRIEVKGRTADGRLAFSFSVIAEVR